MCICVCVCVSERGRCFSNISPRFVLLSGMTISGREIWLHLITASGDITIPAPELVISDGWVSIGKTHILLPEAVDFRLVSRHYQMWYLTWEWKRSRLDTGCEGLVSFNRNRSTYRGIATDADPNVKYVR